PEKSSRASGFALKELMKRVEILTDYELNKSGCSIQYDLKVNPDLDIPGEVSNLVQVLENLISNAIQAYEGKKGLIEFKVTQQDTALVFCIRDSGQGIPEELQSKLFKEMITTKGKKGTGLGLYISYAIIKGKFGGDLWFESAQGQDTAFYISIPI
ncbi:MAG TPA: histidine kinase, partial [Firmicutes bacterium]|nr:histidine kinase [Bacillota bacterium]